MARFISRSIVHPHTGEVYEVDLSIDRLAALRETLSIEIVARHRSSRNNPGQEISAELSVDLNAQEITISIEREEVGRISLTCSDLVDADDADDGEGLARDAWESIRDNLLSENGDPVPDAVETFLEGLPAFDPWLGCVLKGALSAVVPQVIRCYRQLPQKEDGWRRLRALARCLGTNAWGMLGKASWRALRCMVRGGY